MILRCGGLRVLLTCLIFFYNFINLPADPCRSMYPAIFWHIFCHSLLQSCPSACVLPRYDITTPIHCHFHPHVTLIHHFLHNLPHFAHVFGSPSRYHHNHMAIFTTEEETALRKKYRLPKMESIHQSFIRNADLIYDSVYAIEWHLWEIRTTAPVRQRLWLTPLQAISKTCHWWHV